ncbi:hypothetical protein DPMN_008713 [Dreissena polymorpha]|uniref:Uncharacterized protein n=1 Tax=Dreissena polymorpha TaxID=45954 RepID=A0A9D4N104_DREPO|nr:hypothetical protein DPMN_008713 [Dreissena polymorpha]
MNQLIEKTTQHMDQFKQKQRKLEENVRKTVIASLGLVLKSHSTCTGPNKVCSPSGSTSAMQLWFNPRLAQSAQWIARKRETVHANEALLHKQ